MAEEILVPLKRHDRIEEVIPHIEKIAQPGRFEKRGATMKFPMASRSLRLKNNGSDSLREGAG